MFSGIVEEAAIVVELLKDKENLHITMECSFTDELRIDQSISHNGVCLTVVNKKGNTYTVTAIKETLDKSNLGLLKTGDKVNLERSMRLNERLDGHIVQGHVDQTAVCTAVAEAQGSWYFTFEYDPSRGNVTVEKGSVSVNGVSLTVVNSRDTSFQVAIIPYTYEHTNFHQIKVGTVVNLEFDILGKICRKVTTSISSPGMKGTSPRLLAAYIALITAVLQAIIFFLLFYSGITMHWWTIILVLGVLFAAVYFLAYYILSDFIYEKINPIYKTIHNFHLGKKGFRKAMEDNRLIKNVESEVSTWALGKSKEIDQLKQLEKYRREFLGNVSHELKTPIFNIQGYILTLLDGGLEDITINRQYLERTEKSINRMINIVEDLESISRLEAGELKLNYENFNIVALVEDVYEMQEMLARRFGVKLQFGEGHDKTIRVYADRKRIVEAVNNLIVNSIKYSRSGGNTSVSFVDIGDQVIVTISDTGIGIAEKDLPRIFERFYRVDKSRSRDQGGTGLGLSIVKHIIEAHQQTIRVQSKHGEGTAFTFTLEKAKVKKGMENK